MCGFVATRRRPDFFQPDPIFSLSWIGLFIFLLPIFFLARKRWWKLLAYQLMKVCPDFLDFFRPPRKTRSSGIFAPAQLPALGEFTKDRTETTHGCSPFQAFCSIAVVLKSEQFREIGASLNDRVAGFIRLQKPAYLLPRSRLFHPASHTFQPALDSTVAQSCAAPARRSTAWTS